MRRLEPPTTLINRRNPPLIQLNTIPQLARHRSMRLVEGFTIIRVSTTPDFITTPKLHFHKPIRVRERLARHADNISVSVAQYLFSLLKRRYSPRGNNRRVEASLVDGVFD